MNSDETIVNVKTNHYEFPMTFKELHMPHMFRFRVGEEMHPCLEFNVMMPDVPEYFQKDIYTVFLGKVDTLESCISNEITNEYMEKHSLGKELIGVVIKTIKKHFKYVKNIELKDASYIPCNRAHNESLDLLTYSIALYGETWYEKTFGARPAYDYEDYRAKVTKYMSAEFKKTIGFKELLVIIIKTSNDYTRELIYGDFEYYEDLYNKTDTLPNFFRQLGKQVDKKDKCKLFKSWLEYFIKDKIFNGRHIDQKWVISIHHNGGLRRGFRKTRKVARY